MKIDRTYKITAINGRSVIAQYSADGSSSWHASFTDGDLWMRTSTDGGVSWSKSMRIVGEKGEKGDRGDDGAGFGGFREMYLASGKKSGVKSTDAGWTDTPQEVSEEKPYLWNYETVYDTDGEETGRTEPQLVGRWSSDGRGIKRITEWYLASETKDAPAGGYEYTDGSSAYSDGKESYSDNIWSTDPDTQAVSAERPYLLNYEETEYDKAPLVERTESAVIGVFVKGRDGTNGKDGRGIARRTRYYLVTSRSSVSWSDPSPYADGSGNTYWNGSETYSDYEAWSTSSSGRVSEAKPYKWAYTETEYTDGTYDHDGPELIAQWVKGDRGEAGERGKDGKSAAAAMTIGLRLNRSSFTSEGAGSVYVHGFSEDGANIPVDVPGRFVYGGGTYYVKGAVSPGEPVDGYLCVSPDALFPEGKAPVAVYNLVRDPSSWRIAAGKEGKDGTVSGIAGYIAFARIKRGTSSASAELISPVTVGELSDSGKATFSLKYGGVAVIGDDEGERSLARCHSIACNASGEFWIDSAETALGTDRGTVIFGAAPTAEKTFKDADGKSVRGMVPADSTSGGAVIRNKGQVLVSNGTWWEAMDSSVWCWEDCRGVIGTDLPGIAGLYQTAGLEVPDICGTYIRTLTANRAFINELVTSDAFIRKLAAQMITLQDGGVIKSSNYNGDIKKRNGTKGFALDSDGNADFVDMHATGGAFTDITANNMTLKDGSIEIGDNFKVDKDGNTTIKGNANIKGFLNQGLKSFAFMNIVFIGDESEDSPEILYCSLDTTRLNLTRVSTGIYELAIDAKYLQEERFPELWNDLSWRHVYLIANASMASDKRESISSSLLYNGNKHDLTVVYSSSLYRLECRIVAVKSPLRLLKIPVAASGGGAGALLFSDGTCAYVKSNDKALMSDSKYVNGIPLYAYAVLPSSARTVSSMSLSGLVAAGKQPLDFFDSWSHIDDKYKMRLIFTDYNSDKYIDPIGGANIVITGYFY